MEKEIQKETYGSRTAHIIYSITTGQFFSAIVAGITLIAVTRLLQPSNYGLYSFAFGYSALVDAVGAFGIGVYLSSHIAVYALERKRKELNGVVLSSYIIIIIVGGLLTMLGVLLSPYIANVLFKNLGVSAITLMLASATIFFSMTQAAHAQALIGFGKGWRTSIINVSTNIIQLIASVFFIYAGFGVSGAVAGMLVGYISGTILGYYYVYAELARFGKVELYLPSKKMVMEAMRFSTPIGANNLLVTATSNFSILFIGLYVTTAVLGNYGAALRGFAFLSIIYQTMGIILVPAFSMAKVYKKKGSLHPSYNNLIAYSLLLTLPLIVYPAVFATPGIRLFLSSSYTTAGIFMTLIAAGTALNLLSTYLSSLMIAAGKTGKVLKFNLAAAVAQLVAMIILVPFFSVFGAIVAIFFIGNIIADVIFINGVRKLFNMKLESRKLLYLFMSNVALGILLGIFVLGSNLLLAALPLDYLYTIQLVFGAVLVAILYPVVVTLFKVVSRKDLATIKHATGRISLLTKPIDLFIGYSSYLLKMEGD